MHLYIYDEENDSYICVNCDFDTNDLLSEKLKETMHDIIENKSDRYYVLKGVPIEDIKYAKRAVSKFNERKYDENYLSLIDEEGSPEYYFETNLLENIDLIPQLIEEEKQIDIVIDCLKNHPELEGDIYDKVFGDIDPDLIVEAVNRSKMIKIKK